MNTGLSVIAYNGGLGAIIGAIASASGGLFAIYCALKRADNVAERWLLNFMSMFMSVFSLAVLFVILLSIDKGVPPWAHWAITAAYLVGFWEMASYTHRQARALRGGAKPRVPQFDPKTMAGEQTTPDHGTGPTPLSPAAG